MDTDTERLKVTGFVSKQYGAGAENPRMRRLRREFAPAPRERRKSSQGAVFLLVRLGICALLFCGVVALKLSDSESSRAVLSVLGAASGDEAERDTRLGRLRFVEIPSIISVFAPSDRPRLPVETQNRSLASDDTLLVLEASAGDKAYSPAAGLVKSVGTDAALGAFACIKTKDDTEFFVYGLKEIAVEKDQPVTQNSVLGTAENGRVCVRVYQNGRPLYPAELFGLGELQ